MEHQKKTLLFNLGALVCAVWFLAIGWIWVYYLNLLFAYPVGILGFVIWLYAKKRAPSNTLNKYVLWVFLAGLISSLGTLLFLLLYN